MDSQVKAQYDYYQSLIYGEIEHHKKNDATPSGWHALVKEFQLYCKAIEDDGDKNLKIKAVLSQQIPNAIPEDTIIREGDIVYMYTFARYYATRDDLFIYRTQDGRTYLLNPEEPPDDLGFLGFYE